MLFKEIIAAKRDGHTLVEEDLKAMVSGYINRSIPDYQMAAWLMAVFFKGLNQNEMLYLTSAMACNGRQLERLDASAYRVDKHSTGGIGDKTSLIIVPLLSAVAERLWGKGKVQIPMISGRSLGHTGGTLDKLDAVPGFSASLTLSDASRLISENGFVMMGQTADLVPADRLMYALRDATGTVESLPLMVASIVSKKVAENLDGLVFDVKFGSGAFLPELDRARELAQTLVKTSRTLGVNSVALLTPMEEPLGLAIGNRLEVEECAAFLEGRVRDCGLSEVCLALTSQMLHLASRGELSLQDAEGECAVELESRRPMAKFRQMFSAQGGMWEAFTEARALRDPTLKAFALRAPRSGIVSRLDAKELGSLVHRLGGGRDRKEDIVDHTVGIELKQKLGSSVREGQELLVVLYRGTEKAEEEISQRLKSAVEISDKKPNLLEWVKEVIQ